jgi:ABC-type lipoprotein release transport system permease subunit
VQDLPQVLGIGLAVVALLTITHLLMTSVRRRQRDFAILRALGFTSWQVRRRSAGRHSRWLGSPC